MKLQADLREFVELLSSHSVDFVVVGGHAVAFHGYPRFTGDIDIFVRPTTENARRILSVLEAFGFGAVGLDERILTERDQVIQLGKPPNRIDLLTSISGVEFDEVWNTREAGELDGIPVFFPGREALMQNKRASGRAKDLADLEALGEEDGDGS